jgi:hypothetical protein
MRDPETFEQAMSVLTYAIGMVERYPPLTPTDSTRLDLAVARLDDIATKASRSLENAK